MFRKLVHLKDLTEDEKYPVPDGTTHIGIKNGKIGFFQALDNNNPPGNFKSKHSKWRYIELPDGKNVSTVSFPDVLYYPGYGWKYGEVKFY